MDRTEYENMIERFMNISNALQHGQFAQEFTKLLLTVAEKGSAMCLVSLVNGEMKIQTIGCDE